MSNGTAQLVNGVKDDPPRRMEGRQREKWIDAPFQNMVREYLDLRGWTLSDLGRAINRAPSLISRWMSGTQPSPGAVASVAEALGIPADVLLAKAGYLDVTLDTDPDPRRATLIAKIKVVDLDDDRYAVLDSVLEVMRRRRLDQERPRYAP